MSVMWWPSNRAAEADVKKQGGIKPPCDAERKCKQIIDNEFKAMQQRLNDFDVEIDPLLLVQIASFEKGFKIQVCYSIKELREKTKDYGVLTRAEARERIQSDIKTAFGFLVGLCGEAAKPLENYPKRILGLLEWELHCKLTEYVNTWVY